MSDVRALWEAHQHQLSDDCVRQLERHYNVDAPTEEDARSLALCLIRQILLRLGSSLEAVGLPEPHRNFDDAVAAESNRLIRDELTYDREALRATVDEDSQKLNTDQRQVYDEISQAVEGGRGGMFFVDGPGGTGKTFVQNLLLAKLRSEGRIALAVASTGIAATLLEGGRTAHSRFKIPINIYETCTCAMRKTSDIAYLIRRTDLIFWDEAVKHHRHVFEAVDRTFRDLRDVDSPFGGIVICFCGDFLQTLPIIPRGTRGQVVSSCLKRSYLWLTFGHYRYRLTCVFFGLGSRMKNAP